MLDRFKDLRDELKLFYEYWLHIFDKKRISLVADLNSKVVHFGKLRNELFSPDIETNQESSNITEDLGVIVAQAILNELQQKSNIKVPLKFSMCILLGKYIF